MEILEVLSDLAKVGSVVYTAGKVLKLSGVHIMSKIKNKKEQIKDEVTIIIDFGDSSIVAGVEKYLATKEINSTIFVCKNPNGYEALDLEDVDQWRDAVKGIYALMKKVNETSPKKIHIFMRCPIALAFAIGYVSRPCRPYIYHLNRGEDLAASKLYYRVLDISDELRC